MNIRNIIAVFLSLFLCAQISNAQLNIFKGDFEANAKLISDYRFRGVSRTSNDFAVQGGVDFYSDTGLYTGVWASNVDGFNGADAEANLYLGLNQNDRFESLMKQAIEQDPNNATLYYNIGVYLLL